MTTLFSSTALPPAAPVAPKKHTWLPLLTVLFLISYALMTMLIVEQGSTIESQRVLIRELYRDSSELSAVKGKAVMEKNIAAAQHHAQAPSAGTKAPLTQTPSTQAPSSQAVPQQRIQSRAGKALKPQIQVPSRPASDLMDDRRALITI